MYFSVMRFAIAVTLLALEVRLIKGYDSRLTMLNLSVLMVVAFIPFPTALISEYPGQTATIFFALAMIVGALRLCATWCMQRGTAVSAARIWIQNSAEGSSSVPWSRLSFSCCPLTLRSFSLISQKSHGS